MPTDGSDHSIRALEYAQSLIHGQGLEVALIHVTSNEAPLPASLDDDMEPEDPVDHGRRIMRDACHILGVDEDRVEQIIRTGQPAEEIVEAATRFRCNLIIMGSRGRSGWKGSAVGSVSQAVIADAPCSVLVVKEQIEHSHGVG